MSAAKKWYAVFRGRKPGIYTQWFGPEGAKIQIDNFHGARFKGFKSRQDAQSWLDELASGQTIKADNPSLSGTPRVSKLNAATIYTDGGAIHNPGPGGFGAVIKYNDNRREISGGFRRTTNNRMEIMACIKALESLPEAMAVDLYSDSRYVVDAMQKGWAKRWAKNDWMRTKEQPALNADLWKQMLALCQRHEVIFHWVKGHAGNPENERCDQLVLANSRQQNLPPDRDYELSQY